MLRALPLHGVLHPDPRRRQAQVRPAQRRVLRLLYLYDIPPVYLRQLLLLPSHLPQLQFVRRVPDGLLHEVQRARQEGIQVAVLHADLLDLLTQGLAASSPLVRVVS